MRFKRLNIVVLNQRRSEGMSNIQKRKIDNVNTSPSDNSAPNEKRQVQGEEPNSDQEAFYSDSESVILGTSLTDTVIDQILTEVTDDYNITMKGKKSYGLVSYTIKTMKLGASKSKKRKSGVHQKTKSEKENNIQETPDPIQDGRNPVMENDGNAQSQMQADTTTPTNPQVTPPIAPRLTTYGRVDNIGTKNAPKPSTHSQMDIDQAVSGECSAGRVLDPTRRSTTSSIGSHEISIYETIDEMLEDDVMAGILMPMTHSQKKENKFIFCCTNTVV